MNFITFILFYFSWQKLRRNYYLRNSDRKVYVWCPQNRKDIKNSFRDRNNKYDCWNQTEKCLGILISKKFAETECNYILKGKYEEVSSFPIIFYLSAGNSLNQLLGCILLLPSYIKLKEKFDLIFTTIIRRLDLAEELQLLLQFAKN